MEYVIDLLKNELKKEKGYAYTHKKALKLDMNISDKRALNYSIRLAQKRIPQLKKAINALTLID